MAPRHVARTYETFQDQDFYYLAAWSESGIPPPQSHELPISCLQVNEPYFGGDWTKLACKTFDPRP